MAMITRGETCCSGAANYASRAMMLENGIDPKDHVIFASTAGHGGIASISLKKVRTGITFYRACVRSKASKWRRLQSTSRVLGAR